MDCLRLATLRGLINALLELKHGPLGVCPGDRVPFIHRRGDRVHNMSTPTCAFIVQRTGCTSAYPAHYTLALAVYTIFSQRACSLTACSHTRRESRVEVTAFLLYV